MSDYNTSVATKASDEPIGDGNAKKPFKKDKSQKPNKPKRNSNIPAPSPGTYKVMIHTTFSPMHERRDLNFDDSGFMDICEMVNNSLVANFKDLKEDDNTTLPFLGRIALAKQLAQTAVKFDGSINPDIVTVSNYAQEVPAPLFIGASQLGFVSHEGIDHFPEESESQAMKQLLLCGAGVKKLSQEQSDVLPFIEVDFENREFSVAAYHKRLQDENLTLGPAIEATIMEMPTVDIPLTLSGFTGTATIRPKSSMFIDPGDNDLQSFMTTNVALLHRLGWTQGVFGSTVIKHMSFDQEDLATYQAAVALFKSCGSKLDDSLKFDTLYAKIKEIRQTKVMKLIGKITTKIKMVDINALNGKGNLGQFVHTDSGMEAQPKSTYPLASDEAAFGLFFQFSADSSDANWVRDRYEWSYREDLDNERSQWIRSFLSVKQ